MDDVKDKVKGFMKKVNNPFSSSSSSSYSSSGKFKGQGRVLGSSSGGPSNSVLARARASESNPNPSSASPVNPKPLSQGKPSSENQVKTPPPITWSDDMDQNCKPADGFDPFGSLITSGKRSANGVSVNVFECPVCGGCFRTEEEVSVHVETCLDNLNENGNADGVSESFRGLQARVGAFISAKPPEGSVEIVLKLLRNIVREPENVKFRRVRMSNPKIREAIGEVAGGIELLECVGFELREEDGEMWAVMEVPQEERVQLIKKTVSLLEPSQVESLPSPSPAEAPVTEPVEPTKVDRQIRVFFSVPENVASKIQLPESFYNLSIEELRREADMRKKKIAESQLLIPKSLKEKQAKSARRRYKKAVIRVQFPDQVVLQGVFAPTESTGALYEFVSSALKQPGLEFELLHPVAVRRRVIPHFPPAGVRAITIEEEDLVPSALIKFRPLETDSIVFTGLCNELLEISEPLEIDSSVAPLRPA